MDPSLQIDILQEFQLGESSPGVQQVQGLHNSSKAYLFQGNVTAYKCAPFIILIIILLFFIWGPSVLVYGYVCPLSLPTVYANILLMIVKQ